MKTKKRNPFQINDEEYSMLEKQFIKLCGFQSSQLLRKNTKNNHTHELDDVMQELKMHLLIAGIYYKRQIYIENSLELSKKYAKDRFVRHIVEELSKLWDNRKRHGANRQKFGPFQEKILSNIVRKFVPRKLRPSKKSPLRVDDPRFVTYCKSISWNCLKNMGKKITREKSIRSGQVSLSEFEYLQ
jgi:hypothetical protein